MGRLIKPMKAIPGLLCYGVLVLGWRPVGAAQGGGYTLGGLVGQYYASTNPVGSPSFTRRDVRLDFGANSLPPGGAGQVGDIAFRSVAATGFAVQWSGQLIPRFTENYTFKALAMDAFTLLLRPAGGADWTTVINQVAYSGAESTGVYALTAGVAYEVQAALVHGDGAWAARLRWSSPSTPDEVIDPLVDAGINNPDWTAGFTDILRGGGRNWWQPLTTNGLDWGGSLAVDGLGWPLGDGAYVFQESLNQGLALDPLMSGRVAFSFHGSASLSLFGNVDPSSLRYQYDAAQNLTTGSFRTADHGVNASAFIFASARRDGRSNGPPGITDLRMMRPTAPGAAANYDPTNSLFTAQFLDALGHFTVVRHPYVANQQRDWSERTRPAFFNQNSGAMSPPHYGVGYASDNGAAWEFKVLLANESGRDLMISLPPVASGNSPADVTSYLWNLANLLCYGSDGATPYTAPVSNPAYPPLNPNLRVYLELGNELWNWGNPYYIDFDNINALASADADSADADFQALNYDGLSTAKDNSGNYVSLNAWHPRKILLLMMHVSDIFRAVFGDAAMMTRVRPLYEWQYANYNDTAGSGLSFVDRYFNNGDGQNHVANPLPVSHWLWGGGGATYYGALNNNGLTALIPDPAFSQPALAQPGYQIAPTGAVWNFSGTSGIARYEGGTNDLPPPYQGSQVAFITDHGSLSIPVTFPADFVSPVFGVSFKAVNRTKIGASSPDKQSLRVYLDGTNNLTARTFSQWTGYTIPASYDAGNPWSAANVSWARSDYYFTRAFTVQPGETHTVTIEGVGDWSNAANTDQTAFLGEVRVTSVDRIFEDGIPGGGEAAGQPVGQGYQNDLNGEATWAKAFGLEELSYEGGWSLGGDDGGSWVQLEAKYGDPRAAVAQERAMDMFRQAGSAVSVFGTYAQWPSWGDYYAEQGLLDISRYPIIQGIDDRASHLPPEPNNGILLPATIAPIQSSAGEPGWAGLAPLSVAGGWMAWNVIAPSRGQYSATLIPSGTNTAAVLLVDDAAIAGNGQWTGAALLSKGLHSMKVRSTSSTPFQFKQIVLSEAGTLSPPAGFTVAGGDGQAILSWQPVDGATNYQVRFGVAPGIFTQAIDGGAATNLVVQGLTNNQEYFFAVLTGNAAGLSLPSPELGVIPLSPGQTGSLAIWDFDGAVGDEPSAAPLAVSSQLAVGALHRGAGLDPSESDWAAYWHFRDNRFASEPAASAQHQYGANLDQAVTFDQGYEFTLEPLPGQALTLSQLAFRAYFQSGAGNAGVTYSTDGASFKKLPAIGSAISASTPWTVDLTGAADLQDTTNFVTFRIYLFATGGYSMTGLGDLSGPGLVVTGSLLPTVPVFTRQPASQTIPVGADVVLSATAVGVAPLTYQWLVNNWPLAGATNAAVRLTDAQTKDAGSYVVAVSNAFGSATSSVAVLAVLPAAPPALQTVIRCGGAVTFTWSASPGLSYHVQYKRDLSQPEWVDLAIVTATGSTATASDTIYSDARRFYRVLWAP